MDLLVFRLDIKKREKEGDRFENPSIIALQPPLPQPCFFSFSPYYTNPTTTWEKDVEEVMKRDGGMVKLWAYGSIRGRKRQKRRGGSTSTVIKKRNK